MSGRSYGRSRTEIAQKLRPVLGLQGLRVYDRRIVERAIDIAELYPDLDFEDALIAARIQLEDIAELYSYDRGFDRVPGITRIEPPAVP